MLLHRSRPQQDDLPPHPLLCAVEHGRGAAYFFCIERCIHSHRTALGSVNQAFYRQELWVSGRSPELTATGAKRPSGQNSGWMALAVHPASCP